MKTFKLIDFWINVLLIIIFGIIGLAAYFNWFNVYGDLVILGYFIIGGWQVISMMTHYFNHWFIIEKGIRYQYHQFAIANIVLMVTLVWFYILLFIAPFLAIFYTWICYNEIFVKMKRPLADLM
jgi:hypothetical protein